MHAPRSPKQVYFENLDGLRTIAFMMVFIWHAKLNLRFQFASDTAETWALRVLNLGPLGVNLFFVLSGFLITYLLLREQGDFGRIHLGRFYMRRLLRIWPLYYLTVFLALVLVPLMFSEVDRSQLTARSGLMYLAFLVNFDHINYGIDFRWSSVLWSVSVEEQFYLFWPVLLIFWPRRRLPWLFALLVLGSFGFRSLHSTEYRMTHYHTLSVLNDLVIGGWLAWIRLYRREWLAPVQKMPRALIVAVYLLGAAILIMRYEIFVGPRLVAFNGLLAATYFGFALVEQIDAEHSPLKLSRWRIGTALGKYTYSLYCLHFFAIFAVRLAADRIGAPRNDLPVFVLEAFAALAGSFLLAWTSYHLLESPFLRLKRRFAVFVRA